MRALSDRLAGGVSTGRLVALMLFLIALGIGSFIGWLVTGSDPGEVDAIDFAYFTPDSTATVSFAGAFPPSDRPALGRPLGIAGDGERLFIAEADAGLVSVRSYAGALIETLTVLPAPGAAAFYPVDVALLPDGTLGIVDTAGSRVVWVDPDEPGSSGVLAGAAEAVQPTAITASDDEVFVADAVSATVVAFSLDSQSRPRRIGDSLDPPLAFAGGLAWEDRTLLVADSNAGRVLRFEAATGELVGFIESRLELPRDLTALSDGRIVVVETFARVVSIFDSTGATRDDTVGDEHTDRVSEGGILSAPEGVFWDARELRLYVTDAAAGQVKVYNVREETQ